MFLWKFQRQKKSQNGFVGALGIENSIFKVRFLFVMVGDIIFVILSKYEATRQEMTFSPPRNAQRMAHDSYLFWQKKSPRTSKNRVLVPKSCAKRKKTSFVSSSANMTSIHVHRIEKSKKKHFLSTWGSIPSQKRLWGSSKKKNYKRDISFLPPN